MDPTDSAFNPAAASSEENRAATPSSSNVISRNAKEFMGLRRQNEHRVTSSKGPPPQWKACFRCYFAFLLRWADLACPARSLTTLLRPTREASRCADAIYAGPTSGSHSNTTATPSIRTQANFTLIQAEDQLWRRQGFMLSPSQKNQVFDRGQLFNLATIASKRLGKRLSPAPFDFTQKQDEIYQAVFE